LVGALGTRELRWSTEIWGGGGGGSAAAIAAGAAAIVTGQAEVVAVYRCVAENAIGRLGAAVVAGHYGNHYTVHGMESVLQNLAIRTQRMIEFDGVAPSAIRAVVQAYYYHARRNPRAVGKDTVLDVATYDSARFIAEPYRLFDCSRENDGAAAILLVSAERARDLAQTPAYLLAATWGAGPHWGALDENHDPLSGGGFREVAKRLWSVSGYGPEDVDVAQVYCNFSGPAVAALIDHGFCTAEESAEKLTLENLVAPDGWLPINTGGGDLAEGFMHGMGNTLESVRQIRGQSPNQVRDAKLSLLIGGPSAALVSSALFGTAETL
jgi:acetyl-CoA acetyltransferase